MAPFFNKGTEGAAIHPEIAAAAPKVGTRFSLDKTISNWEKLIEEVIIEHNTGRK